MADLDARRLHAIGKKGTRNCVAKSLVLAWSPAGWPAPILDKHNMPWPSSRIGRIDSPEGLSSRVEDN